MAVEDTGDNGLITEEETTAAGFLADQRHQLVIRNEGAGSRPYGESVQQNEQDCFYARSVISPI